MRNSNNKMRIGGAILLALSMFSANAKVSQSEANRLGVDLTPLGGEMAGNKAGTIPAWNGGITSVPAGYKAGDHHPNPFPDDKIQFTITPQNLDKYKDALTPGQLALFETYPTTYKINVYQTRRTSSYPQYVYDETKKNAVRSELIADGNGMKNAAIGTPFPIPQNALEVLWNHIVRYRGVNVKRSGGQAAPTRDGTFTFVQFEDELMNLYDDQKSTPESLEKSNLLFLFKQSVSSPARLAGTALLVHETLDQVKEPRQAWTYNTGQRRVRRAPNVAYDAPGTASDGLRTTDDFDMFNGAPNRYNWTLKGKKEIYILYNSYELHSDKHDYNEIIQPGHINPDLVRWELHRVWIIEGNLNPGTRHVYKKRVFYIDEDSWQIAEADVYNNNDQLWRVEQAHILNYYEVPVQWSTLETYYDLLSGRYIAIGLDNKESMYEFNAGLSEADFTPSALRRSGIR